MTSKVCAEIGCPNLAAAGATRCPSHAPKPWTKKRRRRPGLSLSERRFILRRDGNRCRVYGCGAIATEVDHIRPLFEGGTDDRGNLQALCKPHHREKTATESARARWPDGPAR